MLKRYQAPSEQSLQQSIQNLDKDYTKEKSGFRGKQIRIIQALLQTHSPHAYSQEILIGACIYIYLSIKGQWSNPENSQLFQLIKKALNIDGKNNPNVLDDYSIFIYLMHFYNYAKETIPQEMQAQALAIMKTAKQNLAAQWKVIFKRPPTYAGLVEGVQQLRRDYEEKCAEDSTLSKLFSYLWLSGHSPSRLTDISLIEAMNAGDHSLDSSQAGFSPEYAYHLLFGTLLFVQLKIAAEYEMSLLAPESSILYQKCKWLTNIDCLADIDNKILKKDLAKVLAHVSEINASRKQSYQWDKQRLDADSIQNQLAAIIHELRNTKGDVTKNDKLNKMINKLCAYISTGIVQAGIATGLAEVVSLLVVNGLSIHSICYLLNPSYAALGFSTLLAGSSLYKMVGSGLSSTFAIPLNPIISTAVKAPIYGYNALRNLLFGSKNIVVSEEEQTELAKALYHAHSDLCSKEEKEKLGLLFDKEVLYLVDSSRSQLQTKAS